MKVQRKATAKILEVRPLVEADLQYLREKSVGTRVANIKDSHHNIARLLSLGIKLGDIAERLGYSYNRIALLSKDPSVQELVAQYRARIDEKFIENVDEFQRTAIGNMVKAERMIADKIDEADANGETLPMRELLAVTSDRMDRFGYGKKNMNLNLNVDFAAHLEKAIARSKKVSAA